LIPSLIRNRRRDFDGQCSSFSRVWDTISFEQMARTKDDGKHVILPVTGLDPLVGLLKDSKAS